MFLEIKGIKKSFGSGESHVDVLKGIDLEIEKGEFCVLLHYLVKHTRYR